MTATAGRDPGELYEELTHEFGAPVSTRVDAPATADQRARLGKLSAKDVRARELAGEKIDLVIDRAPGNDAPIGGVRVNAASGWFAARPSGTEDIYKIYAESLKGEAHLERIVAEAQAIVGEAIGK